MKGDEWTLRAYEVVILQPEVVQDLCRSESRRASSPLRGTEVRVEARPSIQQHVRHVGSQCDRLLLSSCSGLEVFEGVYRKADVGSDSSSDSRSGSGFGCGSNAVVQQIDCGVGDTAAPKRPTTAQRLRR